MASTQGWIRSATGAERHSQVLLIAYNAVWWLPIALAMVGIVSARFAFLGFLAFSVFRAAVNLYRNNIMPVDQAELFPLRLP